MPPPSGTARQAGEDFDMRTVEVQDLTRPFPGGSGYATPVPPTVITARTISEFEEIRDAWIKMQQHPNSDIDQYLIMTKSLPGVLRPHVVMVHRNGQPEAILVGRLEKTRINLRLGYRNVLSPQVRSLTFIYGGLLGRLSHEGAEILAHAILTALNGKEADVAFFNHLRAGSPLYDALRRQLRFLSRDYFPMLQEHRAMTVPGSADEFWHRLSPKVRKNQRWQAKKLLNDHGGDVQVRCFRKPGELNPMIRDVEQVAAKTYQRGLGVGFADNEITRSQLKLKAEKGWLRTYVLYVAGRPCAFWLGTLYCGTFHSDSMGYDPEFSKYSPGMYLIIRIIEGFCERESAAEISAIDFGLGDAQYKEMLGDIHWNDVSFYVFARSSRGVALNVLRTPVALVDQTSKSVLQKTQLIQRVKTAWRNRVRNENAK